MLCLLRDFPCRENIPLPGRLASFLILLPKLEGQLDVPEHGQQPGAGPQQLHGAQRTGVRGSGVKGGHSVSKKAAFSPLSLWILDWFELPELSREVGRGLAALLGLL